MVASSAEVVSEHHIPNCSSSGELLYAPKLSGRPSYQKLFEHKGRQATRPGDHWGGSGTGRWEEVLLAYTGGLPGAIGVLRSRVTGKVTKPPFAFPPTEEANLGRRRRLPGVDDGGRRYIVYGRLQSTYTVYQPSTRRR